MHVNFFATLRPVVGSQSVDLAMPPGATIEDLVRHVVERWPAIAELLLDEEGELSRRVHVFVNGRSAVYLEDGLRTPLTPEMKIDIAPAVAGG